MIIRWIFLVLALLVVPGFSLRCYQCNCPSFNTSACNCGIAVDADPGTHCTIIENFDPSNSYLELSFTSLNSSYIRITDPYYIIVDESIFYNETSDQWLTRTKRIIYGCDWDDCNRFSLYQPLTYSFNLTIDSTWLNENIYGNGSVNGCNNCSNEICGNNTDSIDVSLCSFQPCDNNATTCSLRNSWQDVDTNELCYQSECTPPGSTDDDDEIYKVRVEAIVYLAQNRSNFDIWQLNINCAAYNCSHPSIFQEVKDQIQGEISDLTNFPATRPTTTTSPTTTTTTPPTNPLSCYKCSCTGATCPCNTTEVNSADRAYCAITRIINGQTIYIDYRHIYSNSTAYYPREYPYVLVKDSITYNEIYGRWYTQPLYVIYGCNTDLCNKPDLLPYLPISFQMRVSESWLNATILGNGQPVSSCHICLNGTVCSTANSTDDSQCPVQSCNTTCLVSEKYDPSHTELCYDSQCAPEDSGPFTIDKYRVDVEGVLYPSDLNNVELWGFDIYCQAQNCSRGEVFDELRQNLTLQTGDLTILFNQTAQLPKIRCYSCYCTSDQNCDCATISTGIVGSSFCTIVRNYNDNNVSIYFNPTDINPSYTNVQEYPFVVAKESILYDNQTGQWFTRTNEVIYGCNWDYCNTLSLLSLLPTGLQASLPASWLNSTILDTQQSLYNCYTCAGTICSVNNNFNASLCSIDACNTTCFATNTYVNTTTDEQCYQAYCLPEDSRANNENSNRIDVEVIVYESQPDVFALWKTNVYCRVDNCSHPEIFQEVQQNLVANTSNLALLFNQSGVVDPNQLHCYGCSCMNDPICACNTTVIDTAGETYCTIIRYTDGQDFWIYLEPLDRNSSYIYIREFPYMLVDETILFNHGTGRWNTVPTLIVYGCNTNFCNDPRLIPYFPVSFQLALPETWLNTTVLGNESPVRDCHECPDAPQCGTTEFLDASRCPIKACNTTCLVKDTFDDPTTNELCYQSYCLSNVSDQIDEYHHRVEIEGILYGNVPNAELELWEIDLYCRADDCSRPELFQEIAQQLQVDLGDLSAFFNMTTVPTTTAPPVEPTLTCFDCFCVNTPTCVCDVYTAYNSSSTYCTIMRQDIDDGTFYVFLEHVRRNSTRVYIREFPYLLAEESILYNETTQQWRTRTNLVVYGCNWDLCNHPGLVPYLPNSFQMRLSDTWLNTNVLGTGAPVRDCHECPDAPQCGLLDFLDAARCPIAACNTTCVVSDLYSDPDTNEQCYQSFCAPPDSEFFTIDPHRVEMEGILYLQPQGRDVELWEIDILCRADDCSRPEIFNEIRSQFTVSLGDLSVFYNITPTPTSSTSTTSGGSVSTTSGGSVSTTAGGSTLSSSSTNPPGQTTTTTTSTGTLNSMKDIILISLFLLMALLNSY